MKKEEKTIFDSLCHFEKKKNARTNKNMRTSHYYIFPKILVLETTEKSENVSVDAIFYKFAGCKPEASLRVDCSTIFIVCN